MSELLVLTWVNLASTALVVVITLTAQRRFQQAIFRPWGLAHAWELAVGLGVLAGHAWGRSPGLAVALVGAAYVSIFYLLQTGRTLQGRPLPRARLWQGLAVFLGAATAGALGGAGYNTLTSLGMAPVILALGWLGWTILRHPEGDWSTRALWLGYPLLARVAVLALYPVLTGVPLEWLLYALSALLHVITGVGMVMALAVDALNRSQAANAELRQLDQLKTNFLSVVSHELRTPLTVIKGAGALLQEPRLGPLTPAQAHMVDSVTEQSAVLERLVNDLLEYTQLESGQASYHLEDVSLGSVVEAVLEAAAEAAERKGVTLASIAPEELGAHVDPHRLSQALGHLVANGIKFTPEGGRVCVSLQRAGQEVHLAVADTGIGIAAEHQPKLFTKFFQADGGSTRRYGGVGLGLALARAIVEDGHGGRIWADSRPGLGSTFTIALPLAACAETAECR